MEQELPPEIQERDAAMQDATIQGVGQAPLSADPLPGKLMQDLAGAINGAQANLMGGEVPDVEFTADQDSYEAVPPELFARVRGMELGLQAAVDAGIQEASAHTIDADAIGSSAGGVSEGILALDGLAADKELATAVKNAPAPSAPPAPVEAKAADEDSGGDDLAGLL